MCDLILVSFRWTIPGTVNILKLFLNKVLERIPKHFGKERAAEPLVMRLTAGTHLDLVCHSTVMRDQQHGQQHVASCRATVFVTRNLNDL